MLVSNILVCLGILAVLEGLEMSGQEAEFPLILVEIQPHGADLLLAGLFGPFKGF